MKVLLATLVTAAALAACSSQPAHQHHPHHRHGHAMADTPTRSPDGHLIGPDGRALYVYARDVAGSGRSVCNDACARNWPPLAAPTNAQPVGDYTIITRADGSRQWAYKGQPLYHFSKDRQPADRTGDGIGGVWKLARP